MNIIFMLVAIAVLHPAISSGMALVIGVAFALVFGNPYSHLTKKYTSLLLMGAVVGLGFGMDLNVVGKVGLQGIGYTIATITLSMVLGLLLGRLLKVPFNSSVLLSAGTAICGGSAIAAVAPAIGAKHEETSVALGTVFLLNSLALFIFPTVGHWLQMDQTSFGLWSALAIHDTSSVVGASMLFGPLALSVGTTVKLARALWIAPLTLAIIFLSRRDGKKSFKFPWFIIGFILAAALATYVPALKPLGENISLLSRRVMVLTLFLIGANLNMQALKSVGARPLIQGVALWLVAGVTTLFAILQGFIHL